MTATVIEPRSMKDLPAEHLLAPGTAMCAGCGGLEVVKQVYDALGENVVFVNAAGCMTLLSIYPFTPFRSSWIFTAMACAPAGAQGVRDALDVLIARKKLPESEDLKVVVLTGDGSANGMGLSATSGCMDRKLDFYYLCYDNEGYGNTGQQSSMSTPHGARTSTSKGGYPGYKKDLFSVWAAHEPAYLATLIGSEPLDVAKKVARAQQVKGPKMFIALAPCPTGWSYEAQDTVELGRLAVKTGVWPLKEYVDGEVRHTKKPKQRAPVDEYLRRQGRFSHLFRPRRDEAALAEIQANVDAYWADAP